MVSMGGQHLNIEAWAKKDQISTVTAHNSTCSYHLNCALSRFNSLEVSIQFKSFKVMLWSIGWKINLTNYALNTVTDIQTDVIKHSTISSENNKRVNILNAAFMGVSVVPKQLAGQSHCMVRVTCSIACKKHLRVCQCCCSSHNNMYCQMAATICGLPK